MSLYEEHVLGPVKAGLSKPNSGIPIPMPKLAKKINYIERGQTVVIGGRPDSGETELMDYFYFVNVYKWWRDLGFDEGGIPIPDPVRPPLKMIYFNMKADIRIKLQKWLCLYMKLEFDTVIDISTLNSGIGRLYDLDSDTRDEIVAAQDFFDELEENILDIVNGPQTPSSIYNHVRQYMDKIGDTDDNGYTLDANHRGQYTMVYIDNADYMQNESDGFQMMNAESLKKKVGGYIDELKSIYGINTFLVAPSKVSNSRMVKDSEPSYKELGYYAKIADVGLITYNPFNENNGKYLGYPVEEMIIKNKNRFRTISIVINEKGDSNLALGAIYLGECGYFRESPHPNDEAKFEEFQESLRELP